MPIYHRQIVQNSRDWFRIRAGKVTGSCIKQILTPAKLEKSASSRAYMNLLLAEQMMAKPVQQNTYQSEAMEFGNDNETAACEAFEFQQELATECVGFVEREDRQVGCSPDRLIVGRPEGLELKSPTFAVLMGYLRNLGELLMDYRLQCQFQCWICELEATWLCAHHAPLPPVTVRVPRDQELIDKIEAGVEAFLAELHLERIRLESRFGAFPPPWMPDVAAKSEELDDAAFFLSLNDLPQDLKEFASEPNHSR